MPTDAAAATSLPLDPRSPRLVAVSLSALAHAVLAFASGMLDYGPDERPSPRPLSVVVLDASVLPPPRAEAPLATPPDSRTSTDATAGDELRPAVDDRAIDPGSEARSTAPASAAIEPATAAATERAAAAAELPDATTPERPVTRPGATPPSPLLDDAEHTRAQRERLQRADLEIATALEMARARDAILHRPRPRSFSLADLVPETPPEEPGPRRGIFESPSAGRAGLEERTALGQTVRWVSDECFQTSGMGNMFGFPAGAAIYNLPVTNCVRTKPRRDLFEHLKPER